MTLTQQALHQAISALNRADVAYLYYRPYSQAHRDALAARVWRLTQRARLAVTQ